MNQPSHRDLPLARKDNFGSITRFAAQGDRVIIECLIEDAGDMQLWLSKTTIEILRLVDKDGRVMAKTLSEESSEWDAITMATKAGLQKVETSSTESSNHSVDSVEY
jgi:hypothetical protein